MTSPTPIPAPESPAQLIARAREMVRNDVYVVPVKVTAAFADQLEAALAEVERLNRLAARVGEWHAWHDNPSRTMTDAAWRREMDNRLYDLRAAITPVAGEPG